MTTAAITNCVSHGANSQGVILCLKCANSFALNVEQSKCLAIPNQAGCLYASNYSCLSCSSQFILTQDSYKISLYNTKSTTNALADLNYLLGDSAGN